MDAAIEKSLKELCTVFLKENAAINLSAFRTEEACWVGNILDSLAFQDLELPPSPPTSAPPPPPPPPPFARFSGWQACLFPQNSRSWNGRRVSTATACDCEF